MALIPEIDEKQTEKNVKQFLKGHYRRSLRAGKIESLQSTQMTGMPMSHSVLPIAERHIINRLEAQEEVKETCRVIQRLDYKSQVILNNLYLMADQKYDWEIMNKLGYGKTQYTAYKHWALLCFADGYNLDDLHGYK